MCFKNSQHSMISVWCKYSQYCTTDYMDSINSWTNIPGTSFSCFLSCLRAALGASFITLCIQRTLHSCFWWLKGEIWRREKITQITDMILSLPFNILPCLQLGLSYTIYTAISHWSKNIVLKRSMLQVL